MKCICCNEKEAQHQKRGVCHTCYGWLTRNSMLDKFPPVFPLKKKDKWKERYNDAFLSDMKDLVDNYQTTLESVAQKHGVTRERIRQVFELLYGFKYRVALSVKSDTRYRLKREARLQKMNPQSKVKRYPKGSLLHKGAETEKKVFDICASLGYEIKPYETNSIDLVINGYKVEVKSAYKTCFTHPSGKTPQYHFRLRDSQLGTDFVVCHAVPQNNFFVIPISEFPRGGELYIPQNNKSQWMTGRKHSVLMKRASKYYAYLEAWHLLKKPESEIVFSPLRIVASK